MTPRFEETKHEGIVRDTRSGYLYLRDTVHTDDLKSVWVDRSLKTKAIGLAFERATSIRRKISQGHKDELMRIYTFDDAFDLLNKIQSTKAFKTIEQTTGIIEGHLRPWFKTNCSVLRSFEQNYEEKWAEYQIFQRAKKQRKLEHDRRYLVMALKRARNKGWIKKEFTKDDFELNEVTEPIGQYIDHKQVMTLLMLSKKYPKLYLQILLAVTMGMRISEILHLKKDEINLKSGEIDLDPKRVKTRRRREVPIPIADDVFPILLGAFKAAKGDYIFPAWRTNSPGQPLDFTRPQDDNSFHWDKIRNESNINVRFHDLRHTAITNMLKSDMPDFSVRKICGVSEATMRRIYAHVEGEMKERFRKLFCGKYVE